LQVVKVLFAKAFFPRRELLFFFQVGAPLDEKGPFSPPPSFRHDQPSFPPSFSRPLFADPLSRFFLPSTGLVGKKTLTIGRQFLGVPVNPPLSFQSPVLPARSRHRPFIFLGKVVSKNRFRSDGPYPVPRFRVPLFLFSYPIPFPGVVVSGPGKSFSKMFLQTTFFNGSLSSLISVFRGVPPQRESWFPFSYCTYRAALCEAERYSRSGGAIIFCPPLERNCLVPRSYIFSFFLRDLQDGPQ